MADRVYLLDNCRFTSTTTGTGNLAQGATPAGYLSPAAAGAQSGQRFTWKAENEDGTVWEEFEGRWLAGNPPSVTRDRIIRNSSGGTGAINWQTGTRRITCVAVADRLAYLTTDGKLPLEQAPAEMGMVLLLQQGVASPVAGVNFAFPGGFSEYEVRFGGVAPSTPSAAGLRVSLSFPGSPTAGAQEYNTQNRFRTQAGATVEYSEFSNSGNIGSIVRYDAGQERMSGLVRVTHLGGTDQYSHLRGDVLLIDHNSGGAKYWNRVDSAVVVQRQATPTGMGLFFAGGASIIAGLFRLYGIR